MCFTVRLRNSRNTIRCAKWQFTRENCALYLHVSCVIVYTVFLYKWLNFFSPSSDIQPLALPHQSDKPPDFLQKLIAAEKFGTENGNCGLHYSDCILSIVDLFTNINI